MYPPTLYASHTSLPRKTDIHHSWGAVDSYVLNPDRPHDDPRREFDEPVAPSTIYQPLPLHRDFSD